MSKEEEVRNANTRRRNILFLIQKYLQDNGYYTSAETLATESRLPNCDFEVCDNIDLDSMYLEYASYFMLKFGKHPRILRKAKPAVKVEVTAKQNKKKKPPPPKATANSPAPVAGAETPTNTDPFADLQVCVKKLSIDPTASDTGNEGQQQQQQQLQEIEHHTIRGSGVCGDVEDQLLAGNEWDHLTDVVRSTIMREEIHCSWSGIYGNRNAMEIIKEAVVTPLKYPQLFVNGLKPWRSVLLHGPPGSGKTLLAKTLYAETRELCITFFNITSSVIISKWRGESEKILRLLFRLARKHSPSVIFLDEIEGLTSRRDRPTDHESSKRFKNELLQLLDGIEHRSGGAGGSGVEDMVFILASTNLPWDIDDAFIRRFEKKILVQLPIASERKRLIERLLPLTVRCTEPQLDELARLSDGFTGDEIRLACKELAMQHVRRITKAPTAERAEEVSLTAAFERIRPLSNKLMGKHIEWNRQNGT